MRCAGLILIVGSSALEGCSATGTGGHVTAMTKVPTPRDGPSRVEGARAYVQPIWVTPADGGPFALGVVGAHAWAELPARGARALRVHVVSPLDFDGLAQVEDVPFQVARATEVMGGRLRIAAGARVEAARATSVGVAADITLAPGVVALDVPVDADLLTLDFAERSSGMMGSRTRAFDTWVPRGPMVHVQGLNGAGPFLVVELAHPFVLLLEQRGEARDGLLPIEVRWADGSALDGAVSLAELRRLDPGETVPLSEVTPLARAGVDACGVRTVPPGITRGTRHVAEGAVVYAEPGRGVWAHVAAAAVLEIEHAPGSAYAAIVRAPGLVSVGEDCLELAHAWVEASAIAASETGMPTPR